MGDPDRFQQSFDHLYERLRAEMLSTFVPPSDQGTTALPVVTPQVTSPADTTSTAPVPPVDNEPEVERLRPRSDLDRR